VARPVFKTGLRSRRGRGGSIPPHSAARAVSYQPPAVGEKPRAMVPLGGAGSIARERLDHELPFTLQRADS
jgi:hypothetical protein